MKNTNTFLSYHQLLFPIILTEFLRRASLLPLEQWWAWILVDVVCCGLYIYKELYFTSALYGLYSIIAIFGYFKWKQMMHYESK